MTVTVVDLPTWLEVALISAASILAVIVGGGLFILAAIEQWKGRRK